MLTYQEALTALKNKLSIESEITRYKIAVGQVRSAWSRYEAINDPEIQTTDTIDDIKPIAIMGMNELNELCVSNLISPVIDTSENGWLASVESIENIYTEKLSGLHMPENPA